MAKITVGGGASDALAEPPQPRKVEPVEAEPEIVTEVEIESLTDDAKAEPDKVEKAEPAKAAPAKKATGRR